jgi:membrane-bound lytic murein transglycosylase D
MIAAALLASAAMHIVAQPTTPAPAEAALLFALSFGPPPLTATDRTAPLPALATSRDLTIAAPVTPEVESWLRYFNGSGATWFDLWLGRLHPDGQAITAALAAHGLPRELVYLALIESGLQTHAVSRIGAAGLWQLMPATARSLGLRVDASTDERFDPVASTDAALRLLTELQRIFGDWHLTLAAYNGGQETITHAIAAAHSRDFFTVARSGRLSPEAANFVPKFIAAMLLGRTMEDGRALARPAGAP